MAISRRPAFVFGALKVSVPSTSSSSDATTASWASTATAAPRLQVFKTAQRFPEKRVSIEHGDGMVPSMALRCKTCGAKAFRLCPAKGGAVVECVACGTVIPNPVLRAATATLFATQVNDPAAPLTAAPSDTS